MNCPECGSAVRAKIHFCPECGAELPQAESAKTRDCPHCGAEIDAQAAFCPQCGEQTSGERAASQSDRLARMRARVEAEMRMPPVKRERHALEEPGEQEAHPSFTVDGGARRVGPGEPRLRPFQPPQPSRRLRPMMDTTLERAPRPAPTAPPPQAPPAERPAAPPPIEEPEPMPDAGVKPSFWARFMRPVEAPPVVEPVERPTTEPVAPPVERPAAEPTERLAAEPVAPPQAEPIRPYEPPRPMPAQPSRAEAPEDLRAGLEPAVEPAPRPRPPQPPIVDGTARPSLIPAADLARTLHGEAAVPAFEAEPAEFVEAEAALEADAAVEGAFGARLVRMLTIAALLTTVALATTLLVGADRVGMVLPDLSALLGRGVVAPRQTPTPEITAAPTATPEPPTPTPEPTATSEPTATPPPTSTVVHTVQPGETLTSIAEHYGVTAAEIVRANNLTTEVIRPGQELVIPGQAQPEASAPQVHIVQRGENLVTIARQYNVSLTDLMAANGITNPNLVNVGQELQIPGTGAQTPTPTPTGAPAATAMPAATATPNLAVSATAALTTTPGAGEATEYQFAAPSLLRPAQGETVRGAEDVVLNWTSVGLLADDTWYVINIRREDASLPTPAVGWTTTTAWRILASFQPAAGATSRKFYWTVTVMRSVEGQAPVALSPASEERWFTWE